MKPIVAIVGRPNVGKSSLFNRIVGRRVSVIHDQPGVTRDRIEMDTEWMEHTFTIVDTGGLDPEPTDTLIDQVKSQIEEAMDQATVILCVVDVIAGLHPKDLEIAEMLRQADKPVLLVVNKADNVNLGYDVGDFYRLGLGDPLPVSAIHNIGIAEMLDEVIQVLPFVPDDESEEADITRIAVVGRPNAGKSSLINAILGEERVIVHDEPGTTRDAINIQFEQDGQRFELVDTAGLRRKSRIRDHVELYSVTRAIKSIKASDITWLVIDITRDVSQQDKAIAQVIQQEGKACILVANKWDLIEKDHRTYDLYREEIYHQLPYLSYVPIFLGSALTGQRVPKLLDLSKQIYEEYCSRIPTSDLNNTLQRLVAAHTPPRVSSKYVSLKYITQVDIKPPTFAIFANRPQSVPEHYRQYLIHGLREEFGFTGTPLRLQFRDS